MKLDPTEGRALVQIVKQLPAMWIAKACMQLEESARPTCDTCHNPAALLAEVHAVDFCNQADSIELTPDGGTVGFFCVPCARRAHSGIADLLEKRIRGLVRGARLQCETCGRPIAALHDVMEMSRI